MVKYVRCTVTDDGIVLTEVGSHKYETSTWYIQIWFEYKYSYPLNDARVVSGHWRESSVVNALLTGRTTELDTWIS